MRQYYRVRTKCTKYYKYIFWFVFDVAVTNAFILSLFTPTTIPITKQRLKAFRLQLADRLIGNYNTRKRLGHPRSITGTPHPPPALPSPQDSGPPSTQISRTALHTPSHQEKRRLCVLSKVPHSPTASQSGVVLPRVPWQAIALPDWERGRLRLLEDMAPSFYVAVHHTFTIITHPILFLFILSLFQPM